MDQLVKTGKFIAMILWHKPEAAGITLDEHGWADVSELISGVSKTRRLDMAMLEEIVRTDNKQRFAFNNDRTKIRANQGHSAAVDVELRETEPPELLYHGTAVKYVSSIREKGLIPGKRLYVHLSKDVPTAVTVGKRHGIPMVFTVRSGAMFRDGHRFFLSENGVWLTRHVPADYLDICPADTGSML